MCRSVLLCRCSPLQKREVVRLIKLHGCGLRPTDDAMTLAIGDGANDVGMIKEAHIGVGISGKEGMQAVQNSDYAFAQFAFLQRLLLLHGRWCYRRISLLVVYSFYKNIVLVITQFWFGIQSQFSGQTLYDGLVGNTYNVFFTSGILALAVLDKDASERVLTAHPELYRSGIVNERFTPRVFWTWWLEGLINSVIIYIVAVSIMGPQITDPNGRSLGLDVNGFVVYSAAVICVNIRLAIATNLFTWINWLFVIGSIVIWYLFGMVYSSEVGLYFTTFVYYVFIHILNNAHFWFTPLWLGIVTNIPILLKRVTQRLFNQSLKQKLKEMEYRGEELPGEADTRQVGSVSNRAASFRLNAKNKATSVIFDVGRNNKQVENTGFAMDFDVANVVAAPFLAVARGAKYTTKIASKNLRVASRRISTTPALAHISLKRQGDKDTLSPEVQEGKDLGVSSHTVHE